MADRASVVRLHGPCVLPSAMENPEVLSMLTVMMPHKHMFDNVISAHYRVEYVWIRGDDSVSTIDRMLRREEVEERVGISRSAIYRLMRAGEFPAPQRVGLRAVRWRESDLEAWLASRPHATGNKAAA